MADIAGTAVGIVSLSIQLCQGIVWYVDGVRDAKDKAQQVIAEMNRFVDLLELLENVVGNLETGPSVVATQSGIVACSTAINQIRSKVGDLNSGGGSGLRVGMKKLTKRMTFPFKEPEIKYWKTVVSDIQQTLQTALQALQM